MFRFISLIFTVIYAYFLFQNWTAFMTAFEDKQGVESIVYYGISTLIWVIAIVGQYVAMFSGSEVYVTTQVLKEKEEDN